MRRVPGHALVSEGHPYINRNCASCKGVGDQKPHLVRDLVLWWSSWSGDGHAVCQCGWFSEHLASSRARRQAHREHKENILLEAALLLDQETPTLPLHRAEAGWPRCSTCDGGGCPDCTDPA